MTLMLVLIETKCHKSTNHFSHHRRLDIFVVSRHFGCLLLALFD
jgi:hypothetical protein